MGRGVINVEWKRRLKVRRKEIKSHCELEAYQLAFEAAMQIFELSKRFPVEERYSLVDPVRRSSRAVCSNLAEE
jgi:hypothetical protein